MLRPCGQLRLKTADDSAELQSRDDSTKTGWGGESIIRGLCSTLMDGFSDCADNERAEASKGNRQERPLPVRKRNQIQEVLSAQGTDFESCGTACIGRLHNRRSMSFSTSWCFAS